MLHKVKKSAELGLKSTQVRAKITSELGVEKRKNNPDYVSSTIPPRSLEGDESQTP